MKKSKVLVPALGILCLGMAAAVTGTVAWFSTNRVVTATGMNTQLAASKNLLISKDNAIWSNSVNMDVSKTSMMPTSCGYGEDGNTSFYKVLEPGSIDPNDAKFESDTTFTTADANTDYIYEKVYIQSQGANAQSLKLDVQLTHPNGTPKEIDKAYRLLLGFHPDGSSVNYFTYAPVAGATAVKGVKSLNVDKPVLTTSAATFSDSSTDVAATLTKDVSYTVEYWIWYEGQDPACKTVNAINLQGITTILSFSVL